MQKGGELQGNHGDKCFGGARSDAGVLAFAHDWQQKDRDQCVIMSWVTWLSGTWSLLMSASAATCPVLSTAVPEHSQCSLNQRH